MPHRRLLEREERETFPLIHVMQLRRPERWQREPCVSKFNGLDFAAAKILCFEILQLLFQIVASHHRIPFVFPEILQHSKKFLCTMLGDICEGLGQRVSRARHKPKTLANSNGTAKPRFPGRMRYTWLLRSGIQVFSACEQHLQSRRISCRLKKRFRYLRNGSAAFRNHDLPPKAPVGPAELLALPSLTRWPTLTRLCSRPEYGRPQLSSPRRSKSSPTTSE